MPILLGFLAILTQRSRARSTFCSTNTAKARNPRAFHHPIIPMTQHRQMFGKRVFVSVSGGNTLHGEVARMGKRGSNAFKRNDAVRAIQSARDGGLDPAMMEVVVGAGGGVTFRVFGATAVPTSESAAGAEAWREEIGKLKPKAPKGR
jgi:hypothetical protein